MLTTSRPTVRKRATPALRSFPSPRQPTMAKTGGLIAVMNAKTSRGTTGGSISACVKRSKKHEGAAQSLLAVLLRQRGQARLPDPELIGVNSNFLLKGLQATNMSWLNSLSGWEGGLAPAH